jgi:formylglycine-generating enzyme required for sulfatase activity
MRSPCRSDSFAAVAPLERMNPVRQSSARFRLAPALVAAVAIPVTTLGSAPPADCDHSLPAAAAIDPGGGLTMEFVLIPAGSFFMGYSMENDDADESPRSHVTITRPFYFGKFEVTQEQNGDSRVVRGGAWGDDARFVRSAYRNANAPDGANDGIGFRCVMLPELATNAQL